MKNNSDKNDLLRKIYPAVKSIEERWKHPKSVFIVEQDTTPDFMHYEILGLKFSQDAYVQNENGKRGHYHEYLCSLDKNHTIVASLQKWNEEPTPVVKDIFTQT